MSWIRLGLLAAILAILPVGTAYARAQLIPLPVSAEWLDGEFRLADTTVVEGRGDAARTAALLAQGLGLKTGEEAYRLTVSRNQLSIQASDPRGLFYGSQTLRQLEKVAPDSARTIPAVDIRDAPRLRWRGLLVDVSRRFFGKPEPLRIIGQMADYKLNVLHLHLTNDPGWRLEISGYPKLTDAFEYLVH